MREPGRAPGQSLSTYPGGVANTVHVCVGPDIEVEQDPALIRKGRDPQLEKAVETVLGRIEEEPAAETSSAGISELPPDGGQVSSTPQRSDGLPGRLGG